MNTWDRRFLEDAKHFSTRSKDPSMKIGAVFTRNNNILSTGWNGFPRGIEDSDERLNTRELKYKYVVHAEMNGIYNATHNGVCLADSTLYVYGLPVCDKCALGIIQVGVKRVVMQYDEIPERWKDSFNLAKEMFKEVGIEYETVVTARPIELDRYVLSAVEKLSKAALRVAVDRDEDLFRNYKL